LKELLLSSLLAFVGLSPVGLWAAAFVEGPVSVSLGAEAVLELPEGWRWVAKAQLPEYFAPTKRPVGAWDLGVVLAGEPPTELRLQFEPLGAVNETALPPVEELLVQAQAAASAEGQRRQHVGLPPRELRAWRWEPNYQPEGPVLRFGGLWLEREQETISLQLRWLGRRGVIKLDWKGDEEGANGFIALSEQLDEALHFAPGAALADRQPGDAAAKLDLNGLVMDGLFGRGVMAGGKQEEPVPLLALLVAALAGIFIAAGLGLKAWRGLTSWLKARAKARDDEQRLGYYEKKLGSRAGDVELEEEEKQEGY
jgi:uncharacterized membrane-anchored protein